MVLQELASNIVQQDKRNSNNRRTLQNMFINWAIILLPQIHFMSHVQDNNVLVVNIYRCDRSLEKYFSLQFPFEKRGNGNKLRGVSKCVL